MLDRYWEGPTGRISPEAPVPVVRVRDTRDTPGGAGNVALNIAALGAAVSIKGYTGDDEAADALASMLQGAGVGCYLQRLAGYPTTTKLRVISRNQQLLRLDFEEVDLPVDAPPLTGELAGQLAGCGALVLSDYAKGALDDVVCLSAAVARLVLRVVVEEGGALRQLVRTLPADLCRPGGAGRDPRR